MSVRITQVHLEPGYSDHEHIASYKWVNESDGSTGESNRSTMVDWIDNKKGRAYVGTGSERVAVGVVHPAVGLPYLRTHADGNWTNNLLTLPRF